MKNAPPVFSSGSTGSPLSALQQLIESVQPPAWMVDELQNRIVLFLNHVLMQEPQAQERLRRQAGKPVRLQWGEIHLSLAATPAGLLERVMPDVQPDLRVTLTQSSPLAMAQALMAGQKPGVDIQGDVQLAAEVAWLVDNVRWDVEEDLSRVVGDAAAHTLIRVARTAAQGLKAFLGRWPSGSPAQPATSAGAGASDGRHPGGAA